MFKEWLKQFLAVCICAVIILSPITDIVNVQASNYVLNDTQEDEENRYDAEYYIVEGKDVAKLFDFGLYDIGSILSWVFNFKTYTVIKHYTDNNDRDHYKCFFNTPNLQFLLRNNLASKIDDGYTDETYKVEDTEWVVSVGKNSEKENAITKYGFDIPSYTYFGEYPKELMSTAGILPEPKKWWQVLWRAITSIFGASFIKSPDAENFNSITYMNHTYTDVSEFLINFFKDNYIDYFERKIAKDKVGNDAYFTGPEEAMALAIPEDTYLAAKEFNDANEDKYEQASVIYTNYWIPYTNIKGQQRYNQFYTFNDLLSDSKTPVNNMDAYHFMCSVEKYNTDFKNWINSHTSTCYKMIYIINEQESNHSDIYPRYPTVSNNVIETLPFIQVYQMTNMRLTSPDTYKLSKNAFTESPEEHLMYNYTASIAADINRYEDKVLKLRVNYEIWARSASRTVSGDGSEESPYSYSNYSYGDWIQLPGTFNRDDTWNSCITKFIKRDTPDSFNTSYTENQGVSWDGADSSSGTELEYRNFKVTFVYDGIYDHIGKDDYNINWKDYHNYKTKMELSEYDKVNFDTEFGVPAFTEDDFVSPQDQLIYHQFNQNNAIILAYEKFTKMFNLGEVEDEEYKKLPEIYYRQCMITNEGDDDECWSTKYGSKEDEKTSLSILNVYAFSGIFKITQKYKNEPGHVELTIPEVHQILSTLQTYCGPYYPEVVANMVKLMCATANNEGNDKLFDTVLEDDPRVMPYDVSSLIPIDKENYTVADPRVELYKSHIVGAFIADLSIHLGFGIYIKPQKSIISLAGKITEISVFMQQMCNFDFFDEHGLSPADFWLEGYITVIVSLLVIFFIVKTMMAIIKMGITSAATGKVIVAFAILLVEMAIAALMLYDPDGLWENFKHAENAVINLGESLTVGTAGNTRYLYGDDADSPEVAYYLPYLDTWAKYNTGYGILDNKQLVDETNDKAELAKAYLDDTDKCVLPYIGTPSDSTRVKHWAIILADAFSYSGRSTFLTNTLYENYVDENGVNQIRIINGKVINNNAYRVVDHFMAPRVTIKDNYNGTLNLSTKVNPNDNGQFQSGFVDLIVKLLNCVLCCLLSLIKFLTFLWQWFMFYIVIFTVVLSKVQKEKSIDIVIKIFGPTLALIGIGLYSGVVMTIGMMVEGLLGIFVLLFLFWCTFKVLAWWHSVRREAFFPKTLNWLYLITNTRQYKRNKTMEKNEYSAKMYDQELEHGDLAEMTSKYFNESGSALDSHMMGIVFNSEHNLGGQIDNRILQLREWVKQFLAYKASGATIPVKYQNAYNTLKAIPEYDKWIVSAVENNDYPEDHQDDNKENESTAKLCSTCKYSMNNLPNPDVNSICQREKCRENNHSAWESKDV